MLHDFVWLLPFVGAARLFSASMRLIDFGDFVLEERVRHACRVIREMVPMIPEGEVVKAFIRHVVAAMVIASAVGAQTPMPSRIEFGVAGAVVRGGSLGTGRGGALAIRWTPARRTWASLLFNIRATSFGRTALAANADEYLPGSNQITDYAVDASVVDATIGPEFSATRGRVQPYVNVVGGISEITTNGALVGVRNFGAEPVRFGDEYPIDKVSRSVAMFAIGSGVRLALSSRVRVDAGLRRMFSGRATWTSESLVVTDGPVPPPYEFKRRLNSTSAQVGFSFVP